MRDNSFMECASSALGWEVIFGLQEAWGALFSSSRMKIRGKQPLQEKGKKKKEEKPECSFISILKELQANWPPMRSGHSCPALQTNRHYSRGRSGEGGAGTVMRGAGCENHRISSDGEPGLCRHPALPSCQPANCWLSQGTLRLSGLLSYQKHFSHHNRDLQQCIKKMVNFLKLPFKHRNRIRRLTRSDASPLFDYV